MPPTSPQSAFDVERFRSVGVRAVEAPDVVRPTLVLGSTQPVELVEPVAVRAGGVDLVRRRGGGGAVYLQPGGQLWMDAWIPRNDPLWTPDVSLAAEWVGAWWGEALGEFGLAGFEIHTGRSVPGELGDLVCFAGHGPGELFLSGRKIVGLSQWRAREGTLFSSCAYVGWDPVPLLELLDLAVRVRTELASDLRAVAVGLSELAPAVRDVAPLRERLLESYPTFGVL